MSQANAKTQWTEAEKSALFISLLAAGGPPNWKEAKLPAGRSRMACQHVYMAAVKEARGVTLGDNKNADAVKKRGPKNATSGNGKGATKRKRGKVDHEADTESIGSDDGERALKKVKHEVKSEEEKDVKVETDEV